MEGGDDQREGLPLCVMLNAPRSFATRPATGLGDEEASRAFCSNSQTHRKSGHRL